MTRPGPRILPSVLALVMALGAAAHADPKPDAKPESGAESPEQKRARALELFDKSVMLYDGGRFREAAALLEEAYATFPEPVLLYNLARAYQESGELAKAIDAYERFLAADPDVKDRGGIEQRVVTLREQLRAADQPKETTPPPPGASGKKTSAPAPAASGKNPSHERSSSGSIVPWVVAGTGVVVLGAGIALGVIAKGHHDDAQAEDNAVKAESEQKQAENFALASNVTLVAGGVLAVVGTAWGVVVLTSSGSATTSTRTRLAVGPRAVRFTLNF